MIVWLCKYYFQDGRRKYSTGPNRTLPELNFSLLTSFAPVSFGYPHFLGPTIQFTKKFRRTAKGFSHNKSPGPGVIEITSSSSILRETSPAASIVFSIHF
jgi:hypothetical protein